MAAIGPSDGLLALFCFQQNLTCLCQSISHVPLKLQNSLYHTLTDDSPKNGTSVIIFFNLLLFQTCVTLLCATQKKGDFFSVISFIFS